MNNKWISVNTSPEIGEYVLVNVGKDTVLKGRLMNNGWAAFFADGEKLVGDIRPVTHWQPLPQSPGEEDENTIEEAKDFWQKGNKLDAVKLLLKLGYNLKEAKDYCDENFKLLPNLLNSTENLSKIANKDEWLNEVRGNEPIEETAEKYATELGYPQSDKTQFTCTFWTHHNIAAQGFIDGVNFKNKINKEPVGEDGLLKKFKALRLQIFTKMDSIPTVLSDYPTEKTANDLTQIAKQYSDSKLSELEKWIDTYTEFFEFSSSQLKDKIKSLKQQS